MDIAQTLRQMAAPEVATALQAGATAVDTVPRLEATVAELKAERDELRRQLEAAKPPPAWPTHTVVRGETMAGIARARGIPLEQLRAWNPEVVPRTMEVGTVLRVGDPPPVPRPVPNDGSPVIVVVDRPVSTVFFDDFFRGDTVNSKISALNAWMQETQKGAGPRHPVMWDSKIYEHTVPLQMFSGFRFITPDPTPSREFSRSTVLRWKGPRGSSQMVYPVVPQAGQSYPADGSPRDINWLAVQFEGPAGTHFLPPSSRSDYKSKTLWYFNWHSCSWKSFDSMWRGTNTGSTITGISHFQGLGDDAIVLGGSEGSLFAGGGYAFVDSQRMTPGSAFLRSSLSKSDIGLVMITGRDDVVPVVIDGGEGSRLDGTRVDAQDSDPINGPGMRITAGTGHIISVGFKGIGAKAGAAKGWLEILGGAEHLVERSAFVRRGGSPAAPDLPVVYVGGTAERVKVGLNVFSGWPAGVRPIVQQTRAGRVVACTDPTVELRTTA